MPVHVVVVLCFGSRTVQNADEKDEQTHCESTSFVIQIITYRLILTGNYKVEAHPRRAHQKGPVVIPGTQTRNERIKHEHDVVINMTYYIRPCVRLDSCVLSARAAGSWRPCDTVTHTYTMAYSPLAGMTGRRSGREQGRLWEWWESCFSSSTHQQQSITLVYKSRTFIELRNHIEFQFIF